MELVFKRHQFYPSIESVPENKRKLFGLASKYIVKIKFKGKEAWDTNTYGFLSDSGAFVSYAPEALLESLDIPVEFESYIRGIAPNDACKVKVKFAKTLLKIIDDEGTESRELSAWFAFHPYKSPLLLGMKDIILEENGRCVQNSTYIAWKEYF